MAGIKEMASGLEGLPSPPHHPYFLCCWLNQPIKSCLNSVHLATGVDLVHVHDVRSYRRRRGFGGGVLLHTGVSVLSLPERGPRSPAHPSRPTVWPAHQAPPDHTWRGRLRRLSNFHSKERKGDINKLYHAFLYPTSGHALITDFPLIVKKWSRKYVSI